MAFIEVGDVVFRGELAAANGVAKFKLNAGAINAVDTVNIAGSSVAYAVYGVVSGLATTAGVVYYTLGFTVPEAAFVEITAYSNNCSQVQIDGVAVTDLRQEYPTSPLFPLTRLVSLSAGYHTLKIKAATTGTGSVRSAVKYYRETGQ